MELRPLDRIVHLAIVSLLDRVFKLHNQSEESERYKRLNKRLYSLIYAITSSMPIVFAVELKMGLLNYEHMIQPHHEKCLLVAILNNKMCHIPLR